jgi:hypothetical protein
MTRHQKLIQAAGRTLDELISQGVLSEAEQSLLSACAKGDLAEFGLERPEQQDVKNLIRAGLIRLLALKSDEKAPVHEHGIRIKGAWIDGDLDLENCQVSVELTLNSCVLDGDFILRDARTTTLVLTGSEVRTISAERLRCSSAIALNQDFHAKGEVKLTDSVIEGDVLCNGGRFVGGESGALLLDGTEIKGSVEMCGGFAATGLVSLSTANVSGNLRCSGGIFEGTLTRTEDGSAVRSRALFCDQAKIGGSIFFDNKFHATDEVRLGAAKIAGALVCTNGTFENSSGDALFFEQAKIGASVFLSDGFRANGGVRFTGADVAGYVVCNGGTFEGSANGEAVIGDQAKITGNVLMHAPFSAKGIVRLAGAQIGGNFECSGTGTIEGTKAGALVLYGATIKGSVALQHGFLTKGMVDFDGAGIGGSVRLRDNFRAVGAVRLNRAKIGGDLECHNANFEAPSGALSIDSAEIRGNVFLRDKFRAIGAVRLYGAKIGGNLECNDARFEGPSGALSIDSAEIRGNVFLRDKFRAIGAVRLYGAKIGGNLECSGGSFEACTGGIAIDGQQVGITGVLNFKGVARVVGEINLAGAHAATLDDDYKSWEQAATLELEGFRYDHIKREGAKETMDFLWRTETSFVRWVKKQDKFMPQPWEQLIKALRDSGDARQAKIVAVHKQRELRRAKQITGFVGRFFHAAYGWLYFYGYRPEILAAWVAGVWLAFAGLFWYANKKEVIGLSDRMGNAATIRNCPNQTNCAELSAIGVRFDPLLFSLDQVLPALSLPPSKAWTPVPDTWWGWSVSLFARLELLFGWIATGLFAGIASGLIKKD